MLLQYCYSCEKSQRCTLFIYKVKLNEIKTKYSDFSKGENNAMSLDIGRKVKANSNFDPRYSLASHTSWCTM